MRAGIICAFLLLLTSYVQAGSEDPQSTPEEPADKLCDAGRSDRTDDYVKCLQQAEAKLDDDLGALIARIPASTKVRDEVLAQDVAASARQLWRKNFAALPPAFRAYRDANCEDDSIAAVGYGYGALQWRLACIINETSRQIEKLKKRYGMN